MLKRIWYILNNAFYTPSEISQLLEECLEIQRKTRNELALSGLESIIFACREALKVEIEIILSSE
jgi:hypothetical protein